MSYQSVKLPKQCTLLSKHIIALCILSIHDKRCQAGEFYGKFEPRNISYLPVLAGVYLVVGVVTLTRHETNALFFYYDIS